VAGVAAIAPGVDDGAADRRVDGDAAVRTRGEGGAVVVAGTGRRRCSPSQGLAADHQVVAGAADHVRGAGVFAWVEEGLTP